MFKPVKLLGEVMALAYLVNTNTEYCTFIHYAGHIDCIQIEVCQSKDDYQTEVYRSKFYVDGKHSNISPEQSLIKLKSTLESYLYPDIKEEPPCNS